MPPLGFHDHADHAHKGHAHDDGHGHGGHHHAPASFGRAFAIGITLNMGFVVVEAIYGLIAGSVALLADAGHNLSDVLGLLIAWGATILSARSPSSRFTYGFKSSSIVAALLNAVFLLIAVGAIALESIQRFFTPEPIDSGTVIVVATVGIVINGLTALLFMRGGRDDINIRGAFLHMAADALVSLGVVIAAVVIGMTGLLWIDPLTSLVIVVVITLGTWGLLRDSVKMSLLAVPDRVDHVAVERWLRGQPGVADVHHIHIWPLGTTDTAMTAHLHMPGGHPGDAFLQRLSQEMSRRFRIGHSTFQIEIDGAEDCAPHCAG